MTVVASQGFVWAEDWPDLVPVLALVFTVLSFWWIYLRRGRLVASAPRAYSGFSQKARMRVRLPIAIRNTGAATLLVEDLRLTLNGHVFDWIGTRRGLRPTGEDDTIWQAPFQVRGRDSITVFAEFDGDAAPWRMEAGGRYRAMVEVDYLGHWRTLVEFDLWASADESKLGSYLSHYNRPPQGNTSGTRGGTEGV